MFPKLTEKLIQKAVIYPNGNKKMPLVLRPMAF